MPDPGTEERAAYRFGAFELDKRNGDLRKSGVRIKLQEQPRRVLMMLLEHPGEVITREQIQKNLWPDDTFVDFDNAINSAVRRLRDALIDTAENPRFIETVARRGYRFLAPVSVQETNTPAPPAIPEVPAVSAAPAAPPVRVWKWRYAAVTILAVLSGAVLAPTLLRTVNNDGSAGIRVTPVTANPGLELQPSFSPDGTRVAYVWNGGSGPTFAIYTKLIGAGDPARITRDTARDFSPAWSPDGRWIAALRDYGHESAILLIPASGGQHRELARVTKAGPGADVCVSDNVPHVCGVTYWGSLLAWSADGRYLFTSRQDKPDAPVRIARVSVETGEQRVVTSPASGSAGDFGPAVSPDGRELAFVHLVGASTGDLYVIGLEGSELRRITMDGADVISPVWTRDGRRLIFSSDRGGRRELWRVASSGAGQPVRVPGLGENANDLAMSPSGHRLVYTRGVHYGSLWKRPINGGKIGAPLRITDTIARDKFTHFSPDGKRIAFQSGRSGVEEIWVCDADGTNAVQLTNFGKGMSGSPRWSPDGKTIAFDSNVAGTWNVYWMRADGGHPTRVTRSPLNGAIPNWSRDGQWIYFASQASGRLEVWKARPDGSSSTQVTSGGAFAASESTDGRYLYFIRGTGESGELWKMPVGGGPGTKVVEPVRGRMFTVTQKGIYFAAGAPALELRYLNFANGSVRVVSPLGTFPHADVSPDEKWALYPQLGSPGMNLMLAENFR